MLRNAVASGCVDFVLPSAEVVREISRIARIAGHSDVLPDPRSETDEQPPHATIAIVHRELEVDTTYYKSSLCRQITRWIVLHKLDSLRLQSVDLELAAVASGAGLKGRPTRPAIAAAREHPFSRAEWWSEFPCGWWWIQTTDRSSVWCARW